MKSYSVTVNGTKYEVTVEETPDAAPAKKGARASGTEVKAPLPGSVISYKVREGGAVKKNDVIIVIEAMKMENEIVAPCDGVVSTICVNEGSTVNAGDVLLIID